MILLWLSLYMLPTCVTAATLYSGTDFDTGEAWVLGLVWPITVTWFLYQGAAKLLRRLNR